MRIVIDMQGVQTESRFRGIGRYALSFTQAILRNRGRHEVIIALNGLFPETIGPIRAALSNFLPQENIRIWYAPGPVRECEPSNAWRQKVAELIREAFIASLKPDILHITSLFEGYVDDAVTSIGNFDQATLVSVSLYDLIPLLNPDQYLKPNLTYERYYHRKIAYLRQASLMLAISESSRQEGLTHLGMASEQVVNVSTAADARFHPGPVSEAQVQGLGAKFDLTRPFILYTGGADDRKNLARLVKAYAGLSPAIRANHQLLFAGKMPEGNILRLKSGASVAGLAEGELNFTGYVSDEDLVQLYRLCKVFVFPSWHEGFGLPALEAMACGAAVIGANTSSISEVIGRADALFDPFDISDMSLKLAQVLEDEHFRAELVEHGLEQSRQFSWDESGRRAVAAFEESFARHKLISMPRPLSERRPKLAFVSPLPPQRSGISDYSAELLPALAQYYDIVVVVAQERVDNSWINENCSIRNVQWLQNNAHQVDRVLYQMGNSPYHQHMLSLLEHIPGTVVLHDFFLSGLQAYLEEQNIVQNAWVRALYRSHGYAAVRERFRGDGGGAKMRYPANIDVLQRAQGVIVHSAYSRELACEWYGKNVPENLRVVPLLRELAADSSSSQARKKLGLRMDDFVVCSFGFLDSTKLNHRLLRAWLCSRLAQNPQCILIFVGENHAGDYGRQLRKIISDSGIGARIRILGWTDSSVFQCYLATANAAVQLRTSSRGETSAAVLDCMSNGVATIVNANGAFAELPTNAVWMLPDEFEDAQLIEAIETLWQDERRREVLGERARDFIKIHHAPAICAGQYYDAIEDFYAASRTSTHELVGAIARLEGSAVTTSGLARLAQAISQSLPEEMPTRTLYLDISATCKNDLRTGIERVARALMLALLEEAPRGVRVEPVYLSDQGGAWHYRYARRYTLELLNCPGGVLEDEPAQPSSGDIVVGLDISGDVLVQATEAGLFYGLRNAGVAVYFMVFDLLPLSLPHTFPVGAEESHARWLNAVVQTNGAICISQAVANELTRWLDSVSSATKRSCKVAWIQLGADIGNSMPSKGLPPDSSEMLSQCRRRPTFLMVGTIEPRKGHLAVLEAFNKIWREGVDANLLIVGKEGWLHLPGDMRRTIPATVERLRTHPELGKRLFWLECASDEYLEQLYAASSCLIAASEGEGFGLPIVEAAQHGLPIIAREIPVFREVAGNHAFYFSTQTPDELAMAIADWLDLYMAGQHPKSVGIHRQKWSRTAKQLFDVVIANDAEFSETKSNN